MYASPVARFALLGDVRLPAPVLRLRSDDEAAAEDVPLVDLTWNLYPPSGYRVVHSHGSVHTDQIEPPRPAAVYVAGALYCLGGGIHPFCSRFGCKRCHEDSVASSPYYMSDQSMPSAGKDLGMKIDRQRFDDYAAEAPAAEPGAGHDARRFGSDRR